jgi:hypothetical protein
LWTASLSGVTTTTVDVVVDVDLIDILG